MTPFTRLAVLALAVVACAHAQYQEDRAPRYIASEPKEQASTPVPILKQINRHNEDGSYTYGYEAADGSFKIETKSSAGEVKGKYGYKDDTGKVRVIEYGANKYGFQPAGEGITVAPPTLVDETTREEGLRPGKSQANRNQYRPAPAQNVDYDYNDEPAPPRPQQQYRPAAAPQQPLFRMPAPQHLQNRAPPPRPAQYRAPQPAPQPPQPQQQQQPQQQYRPQQYRPQQGPAPPRPAAFSGAAPSPVQDNFFNPEPPAPQRRQYQPKQEYSPDPRPQYTDFTINYESSQEGKTNFGVPAPNKARPSQPYSMLDQLLKEYALPENGPPALHDISFGSY